MAPSARPPGLSCGLLTSQTWNSSCPRLFAFLCDSLIFCFLSFPKSFFCVCTSRALLFNPGLLSATDWCSTRCLHPTFSRQLSWVLLLKACCFYAADNWILNLSLYAFLSLWETWIMIILLLLASGLSPDLFSEKSV